MEKVIEALWLLSYKIEYFYQLNAEQKNKVWSLAHINGKMIPYTDFLNEKIKMDEFMHRVTEKRSAWPKTNVFSEKIKSDLVAGRKLTPTQYVQASRLQNGKVEEIRSIVRYKKVLDAFVASDEFEVLGQLNKDRVCREFLFIYRYLEDNSDLYKSTSY